MSEPTDSARSSRLHSIAVIFASLIIPAPVVTGKIVEAIMDSSNPAGLADLTVPLAYLTEILVTSFSVLGIVIVIFLIATIMLGLQRKSWRAVSLPVTVAVIQIVVGIVTLILSGVISDIGGS